MLNDVQLRVLRHGTRLRILGLFASDPARSLSPADVTNDLRGEIEATVSQVAYHLARLQAADLIPSPAAGDTPRERSG